MAAIVCRVTVALALLLVTTPAWAQAAAQGGLQGFGIVLVLGDVQEGATTDNIPAAARAALSDLKDFLPYRSYRVLDTAWLLASSTTRQAITSRLRGTDEQEYEVVLDRLALPPSSLQVRFAMSEPGSGNKNRDAALRTEIQQMIAARSVISNCIAITAGISRSMRLEATPENGSLTDVRAPSHEFRKTSRSDCLSRRIVASCSPLTGRPRTSRLSCLRVCRLPAPATTR